MDSSFEAFVKIFPSSRFRRLADGKKEPADGAVLSIPQVTGTTTRYGWIIPDGYIVVDIDDRRLAEIVLKFVVAEGIRCCYFKTPRGMHFIFKDEPSVECRTTAGIITMSSLPADYRTGGKGYIVLPLNDTSREWTHLDADPEQLPAFLWPTTVKAIDAPQLWTTKENRNVTLFEWCKTIRPLLQASGRLAEVNECINLYVFPVPLPRREMATTVNRPDNLEYKPTIISAGVDDMGKAKKLPLNILELQAAQNMMADRPYYSDRARIYVYDDYFYKAIPDLELERLVSIQYAPSFRSASRNEVIRHILTKSTQIERQVKDAWNLIAFKNGVVDIKTGAIYPHSKELFATCFIDRNYNPNVSVSTRVETFITHCAQNDPQKRQILFEMIGDCFLQKAVFQKMYLIYGEGCTGKSTLLRLISNLVGDSNVTNLALQDLETMFYPWELIGKLVNIGDDIPFKKIADSSILKKLTSGESIMVQRKFGQPSSFHNHATMIFTTNKLPATNDTTSGFMRRLVLIDMNTRVQAPSGFFLESFTEEDYEYLLYTAVSAIRAALARGELSRSFVVDNNLQSYIRTQNALSEYIDDVELTKDSVLYKSVLEIYSEYMFVCQQSGVKAMSKHVFCSELSRFFFITTERAYGIEEGSEKTLRFMPITNHVIEATPQIREDNNE